MKSTKISECKNRVNETTKTVRERKMEENNTRRTLRVKLKSKPMVPKCEPKTWTNDTQSANQWHYANQWHLKCEAKSELMTPKREPVATKTPTKNVNLRSVSNQT